MGYNAKIQTPVGVMCGVYIDHTASNRPFSLIEKHIYADIKPMIANSHVFFLNYLILSIDFLIKTN